jgi:tRNA G18 (ribose-2'-O)-methylase SpoU
MGAHLRLPLYLGMTVPEVSAELPEAQCIGADARHGTPIYDFVWPKRSTLIVGSEAQGPSMSTHQEVTAWVRIPMCRDVESLNVAAAAAILIYAALGPSLPRGPSVTDWQDTRT